MKTEGALLWEPGTRSGWTVEEIERDDPQEREVLVRLAATGICHSDDHVDTGDIPIEWAPILGGHKGAGVIEQVGPGVTDLEVGDHVVFARRSLRSIHCIQTREGTRIRRHSHCKEHCSDPVHPATTSRFCSTSTCAVL